MSRFPFFTSSNAVFSSKYWMNFIDSTNVLFSANDSLCVIAIIERASMITSIFFILSISDACNKTYMKII